MRNEVERGMAIQSDTQQDRADVRYTNLHHRMRIKMESDDGDVHEFESKKESTTMLPRQTKRHLFPEPSTSAKRPTGITVLHSCIF